MFFAFFGYENFRNFILKKKSLCETGTVKKVLPNFVKLLLEKSREDEFLYLI